MSNHFGPDTCAHDSIRCEAEVPASKPFEWMRQPHRCTRRAVTGRNGFQVCSTHNRTRTVKRWTGGPDTFQPRMIFRDDQST